MESNQSKVLGIKKHFPSVEKPWMKYYQKDVSDVQISNKTIYDYVKASCIENAGITALFYYGKRISYTELLQKIDSYSQLFYSIGVRKNDYISIVSPSIPETVIAMYALNKLGAVSNFIDPRVDVYLMENLISQAKSKIIICLDKVFPKLKKVLNQLDYEKVIIQSAVDSLPAFKRGLKKLNCLKNTIKYNEKIISWKQFEQLNTSKDFEQNCEKNINEVGLASDSDTAIIAYTGGTTGTPKGVLLTNKGLNSICESIKYLNANKQKGDRFLDIMPVFTSYGAVCGIHLPLTNGFTDVLIPAFKMQEFTSLVKKYKPNYILAVPAFYEKFTDNPILRHTNLSFLKMAVCGGDTMNANFAERFNSFIKKHGALYPLAQGYGMSEVSSVAASCFLNVFKISSVGIPLIYNTIAAFNPESGEELGYNEVGEICISGPSIMNGYFNNPSESEKVIKIHADGKKWIHSGDVGYIDEDGFVFIKNRIKRMIIRYDGHKVFPSQIEDAVIKNQMVRNCAVVGIKDKKYLQGELPVCFVELKDNNLSDSEKNQIKADIMTYCNSHLEERGRPVDIILADIPLTSIGKNDYEKLKGFFTADS